MKNHFGNRAIAGVLLIAASLTQTVTLLASTIVPGTSDLWLAGMPNGTTASLDVAPNHSPVLVTEIPIVPGRAYAFSATGTVRNGPDPLPFAGPDADYVIPHEFGIENGIAVLTAPINSLIGVFLDASQPNLSVAPSGLDFSSAGSRNYLVLSPELKQPFFIGNGLTDLNAVQPSSRHPAPRSSFWGRRTDRAGTTTKVVFKWRSCQNPPRLHFWRPAAASWASPPGERSFSVSTTLDFISLAAVQLDAFSGITGTRNAIANLPWLLPKKQTRWRSVAQVPRQSERTTARCVLSRACRAVPFPQPAEQLWFASRSARRFFPSRDRPWTVT